MGRKRKQRLLLFLTATDGPTVATVFGGQHEVTEFGIVVAVRPAEVVPALDLHELLRRFLSALGEREQSGPVLPELIASVGDAVQPAIRRIQGQGHGVADAGRVAGTERRALVDPARREAPNSGSGGQLGTRVLAHGPGLAVVRLAAV